jgi:hypothetical protein
MRYILKLIKALGRQRLSVNLGIIHGQAEGLAAVAGLLLLLLIVIL